MTDLAAAQQAFIEQLGRDAYLHLLARMRADAWALGYKACAGDLDAIAPETPAGDAHTEIVRTASTHDLLQRAMRDLVGNEPDRDLLTALAATGKVLDEARAIAAERGSIGGRAGRLVVPGQ